MVVASEGAREFQPGTSRLKISGSFRARARRFIRFGLVGLSGVLVNEVALAALVSGLGMHYLLGAVLATQCSTAWNFALVEWWAFEGGSVRSGLFRRFVKFWAVNMVALALRGPILALFTDVLGVHYLLSNVISLAVLVVLRFTLADSWIWKNTAPPAGTAPVAELSLLPVPDPEPQAAERTGEPVATATGIPRFGRVIPLAAVAGTHASGSTSPERSEEAPTPPPAPALVPPASGEQRSHDRSAPISDVSSRTALVVMVVILGAGAFLRLHDLAAVGLNSDEAVYAGQGASIAGNPVSLPYFPIFRAHPLLFQTLLSFFYRSEISDYTGRVLAALVGVVMVGVTYLAGRTIFNRKVGLLAAGAIALMPYTVVVNRQILLDGPQALFSTLALYLLAKYVRTQRVAWLYAASGGLALSFLSKETSIIMLGAIYAFFAVTPEVRMRLREVALSAVVFFLCILPYPLSLKFSGRQSTGEQFLSWQLFRRPNHTSGFYISTVPSALGYLVVALALVGTALLWRRGGWRLTLLGSWILVPVAFFSLWPVKGFQYLLPVAAPVAILASAGLVLLWNRSGSVRPARVAVAVLAVLVAVSLGLGSWDRIRPSTSGKFLAGSGGVPGGREAGRWVERNVPAGARMLALGPSMANIMMFYGHRKTWGLSVSTNPLHRNPVYEPVANPDLMIRRNEIQYVVWDSYSAARSAHFSSQLLRYVDRYSGRAVHTQTVPVRSDAGKVIRKPVIVVYEVRP